MTCPPIYTQISRTYAKSPPSVPPKGREVLLPKDGKTIIIPMHPSVPPKGGKFYSLALWERVGVRVLRKSYR